MFARHKFETLAGRLQQRRRRSRPHQHALTFKFARPQPPLLAADRVLPAVEITRDVNRILRWIDDRAMLRREREHHLARRVYEIAIRHRCHQAAIYL